MDINRYINRATNFILCSDFWPVATLNQGRQQRSSLLLTPDTLTQEVRSLAWMITKKLDSHEMVGSGIISFLQWEVLHDLGSGGGAEEIEVGKVFRACLAGDRGMKDGRVQEIWTWEGIKNSEAPN